VADVSLGAYDLEEPWGRLAEIGRASEEAAFESPGPITTYVLKDRTTRASSILCKSASDAVSLARFLDAHLPELRRFLLEQAPSEPARLRALDVDVPGSACTVTWSFTTGDADPRGSTATAVDALHSGFLAELAPVAIERAVLEEEAGGGKAVLAVCGEHVLRTDVQLPSGPGYRDVQLAAAAALAASLT
jgi:hypothetical protein